MKYLLVVILSLLSISCSKNNGTGNTQTAKNCQLVSVKSVNGVDSLTTNLSYNSDGKLSRTVNSYGDTTFYTYNANQITTKTNRTTASHDTTTLNTLGYIVQYKVYTFTLVLSQLFFYTSDTVLNYMVSNAGLVSIPDTITYHFMDGDLTSMVAGSNTYNYTYYLDKSEQVVDLSIYNQLIYDGALAYSNKHLTKSYSGNSFSEEYRYTFDASGKIVTMTDQYVNIQGSGTVYYYYTYACH